MVAFYLKNVFLKVEMIVICVILLLLVAIFHLRLTEICFMASNVLYTQVLLREISIFKVR